MIFEALISAIAGLFVFVAGLMPELDTPSWLTTVTGHVETVTGQMAPLGVWVPFGAAGDATLLVLAAIAAAGVIRLVRMVLSLLTGGGGS